MEINPIVAKGLEVANLYYNAQRYFAQLILLTEGLANLLVDWGWNVAIAYAGRRVSVAHWNWAYDRGAHLPKSYGVNFVEANTSNSQVTDQYGFYLWFFPSNPSGGQRWVPTGYFFRATPKEGGVFENWKVVPKIAEAVRTVLLSPQAKAAFLSYTAPWSLPLAGDGVENQLQQISVVPCPLASIATSEDLEYITTKAIRVLSESNPDIIITGLWPF